MNDIVLMISEAEPGPVGPGASVTVGTVTTGAPGSAAEVSNSGTEAAAVLDFVIPQGPPGDVPDLGDLATATYSASDTQMLFADGTGVSGDSGVTYNKAQKVMSLAAVGFSDPTTDSLALSAAAGASFTAPNSNRFVFGAIVSGTIGKVNTADWSRPGYPLLTGLVSVAGNSKNSAGTIDRAAGIWTYIQQLSTGATINVAAGLWVDWSGPYHINYGVGAMIMNTNHGTNNTGIFMDLDQSATPPTGNWSIYDNNGYPSWLKGGLALGGASGLVSDPGAGNLSMTGAVTAGAWRGTPIDVAYGGVGASLATTGGASQVLKQETVGGSITVGRLAAADISGLGYFATGDDAANLTGTLNNARLSSIPNAALANSSVTISGHAISLGGSLALAQNDIAGLTTTSSPTFAAVTAGTFASPGATSLTINSQAYVTLSVGSIGRVWVATDGLIPVADNAYDLGRSSLHWRDLYLSGAVKSGSWQGTSIGVAYGGTGANLSATGGASQVLKQVTVGGAVTVGQLAAADISGLTPADSPTFAGMSVGSGTGTITLAPNSGNPILTLAPSPSTSASNAQIAMNFFNGSGNSTAQITTNSYGSANTSFANVPQSLYINAGSFSSGGLIYRTTGPHVWVVGSGAFTNEKMRIDTAGNKVMGVAALATSATDGFVHMPSCAGAPTGTPTAYTGVVPMVFDTTNSKLWAYMGGAWKSVTLT